MFNKLTSLIFAGFVFSLVAFSPSAYSAELHAVLIGDTTDDSLGYAFEKDLESMQEEMKKIAKQTNLHLNVTLLQGKAVTPESVLRQIQSLEIEPEDAVILYFTIHGFRADSKVSQWPSLFFGVSQEGVDFDAVHEMVKKKKPRFLLSIADSCNNEIGSGWIPMISPKLFQMIQPNSKKVQENYRKLFLNTRGNIIVSASTPGQYSWYYRYVGGIYTLKFLESLHETVQTKEEIDWTRLLETANLKVVDETAKLNEIQTPQYQINMVKKPKKSD